MSQCSHRIIDTNVAPVLAHGGGDKELLMSLADHIGTCQQVMEMSSGEEMNALRQLLLRRRYLNLGWRRHALRRR